MGPSNHGIFRSPPWILSFLTAISNSPSGWRWKKLLYSQYLFIGEAQSFFCDDERGEAPAGNRPHGKKPRFLISIVSNSALIVFKIIAGILMCSVAVLSEAIHSSIDLLAAVVAYIAIAKADKPADSGHPFGHGKFENISGFFEALLIFFAAGIIVAEAVHKLIHPAALVRLDWGIAVMAISAVVNIAVSRTLFHSAKKHGSIAIEADALHLGADVLTSLGVMLGLVAIRFFPTWSCWTRSSPSWSPASSCAPRSISPCVRSPTLPIRSSRTAKSISSKQLFAAIRRSRATTNSAHRKNGSRREIDLHIQMDSNTSLSVAHKLCFKVENAVKAAFPGAYVTIHVEPRTGEERK